MKIWLNCDLAGVMAHNGDKPCDPARESYGKRSVTYGHWNTFQNWDSVEKHLTETHPPKIRATRPHRCRACRWPHNKRIEKAANGADETIVYRLKIVLVDSEPQIWRRVLAGGDTPLSGLHGIIQRAMGWENCHLHVFRVGKRRLAPPTRDWDDVEDERKVLLCEVAPQVGAEFFYEYDMGDSWVHHLKVESIETITSAFEGPRCLAGARACPPEDCGGIGGYEDLLVALRDAQHERHEEMLDWAGDDFDPETFDLIKANKALSRIRPRKTGGVAS